MSVSVTVFISLLCTTVGAVGTYLTLKRNASKDDAEEGKTSGVILTEIGYIKSGVDDIKRHQEKQDDQYVQLKEQVVRVEASAKSAHRRLDLLEGKEKTHHE